MSYDKSLLKREIRIAKFKPIKNYAKLHIININSERIAMLCISVYIAAPLLMSIIATIHHNIDYTTVTYENMFRKCIQPVTTVTGITAIIVYCFYYFATSNNILISIKKSINNNKTYIVFVLVTLFMVASYKYNGANYFTIFGAANLGESFYIKVKYFVLLLPVGMIIADEKIKRGLLRSLMIVSDFMVPVAFFLWKTQLTSHYFTDWQPAFTCIFTNINYYGYFLSIVTSLSAAMFVIERETIWKRAALFSLVLNTVALSFDNTMGAWIGCLFACIFNIIVFHMRDGHGNKAAIFAFEIFVITLILTGIFNGFMINNIKMLLTDIGLIAFDPMSEEAMAAGSGRWILWVNSMKLIKENPLFGIGHEGIIANRLYEVIGLNRPHNEYIEYALFYGIPAGVLYFTGCFSVYMRALKEKAKLDDLTMVALVSAFGYLVGAFFGLTLYCTTPYLFIMLGLGYVHLEKS